MNSWYIDRSKNFLPDGLQEILTILINTENNHEDMKTSAISKKFLDAKALGDASTNPNAAFTRFRDHGLIRMNNTVGDSARLYFNKELSFGELIIDLFIKRFAKKDSFTEVRPVVLICKLFNNMLEMGIDEDDVFLTYFECHEYLVPIESYLDVSYDLVEQIIAERKYDYTTKALQPRIELEDNEQTNYSILFNALKQTPLFDSGDDNVTNRFVIRPNKKQREFFKYISENAEEFSKVQINNNTDLYSYYCNRAYGFAEIISPVIRDDAVVNTEDEAKALFEYLFGYDQRTHYDYSRFVKHECFGTYFAFISIPRIAIAKVKDANPQIAEALLKYVNKTGNYYIENIDKSRMYIEKSGEIKMTDNRKAFEKWLNDRKKADGTDWYSKEHTIPHYLSAITSIIKTYNIDICSTNNLAEFVDIDQLLRKKDGFDVFNERVGHGNPSAVLSAYKDFLLSYVESAWFVGSMINKVNCVQEFINNEYWRSEKDKASNIINSIQKGDIIVLKSITNTDNVPFDNQGNNTSILRIFAIGLVTNNPHNGKKIFVKWIKQFNDKKWYKESTGNLWDTIRRVSIQDAGKKPLFDFIFKDISQNYSILGTSSEDSIETDDDSAIDVVDDSTQEGTINEADTWVYDEPKNEPKQVIYYGAPGTGKSYIVNKEIEDTYTDKNERNKYVSRVIFHPDYTYSDFVGSIRPIRTKDGKLDYDFIAGPFTELLKESFISYDKKCFLILEELNRGNAAAIFGDLFQLLDREDGFEGADDNKKPKAKRSKYPIDNTDVAKYLSKDNRLANMFKDGKIWLPSNFNIYCTMNTADQNVFVLDSAFKRRFSLTYTRIDFTKLTKLDSKTNIDPNLYNEIDIFKGEKELKELFTDNSMNTFVGGLEANDGGIIKRNWPNFAQIVNHIIDDINQASGSEQISEDKKLGPFFVTGDDLKDRASFVNKVIYYLKQDVFKYVDHYFADSFESIYSKYANSTKDIFELLKIQGGDK